MKRMFLVFFAVLSICSVVMVVICKDLYRRDQVTKSVAVTKVEIKATTTKLQHGAGVTNKEVKSVTERDLNRLGLTLQNTVQISVKK